MSKFQLQPGFMDDWFVLVDDRGRRVSDADVEGTSDEWREIAASLSRPDEQRTVPFKRCRIVWRGDFCELDSPRNTMGRSAKLTTEQARELGAAATALLESSAKPAVSADSLLARLLALPFREGVCPTFPCADWQTEVDAMREYEQLRRDVLAYLNSGRST